MKTLVIGATGFIGSAITRHLVDEGGEVRIAVRPNSDTRGLDDLDVERVGADLRDIDSLRAALRGCDRLFLTAALFSHWARDVDAFYEVNVTGTRHALQAALEADVSKIVYTSTNNAIGAYGPNPVDEEVVFNYWDTGDHYSISKYLGEVEATRFAARGLAVVIVNPTLVVGPGDRRPTSSGQLVLEVAGGKLPVYTQGWVNVVDVDDVAAGHLLAAERGRVGERYLLGGTNLTVKEYFGLIAEAAGRRPPAGHRYRGGQERSGTDRRGGGPIPAVHPRVRPRTAVPGEPTDRPGHGQIRRQLQLAGRPAEVSRRRPVSCR